MEVEDGVQEALLEVNGGASQVENGDPSDGNWENADFLSLDNDNAESENDDIGVSNERKGPVVPTYTHSVNDKAVLPPWMDRYPVEFPRRMNPLLALHNEIVDFCKLMEPLPEEIRERELLVERVKGLVYSVFGAEKCEVIVFGSQATGLFLPSSDIDLVVQFEKENDEKKTAVDAKSKEQEEMDAWDAPTASPLVRLGDALRHQWQSELSYLEVIENTRIPIVKFTHAPTDISLDVCFDQDTGPKAAQLMKTYLQAMPPLRPLTFVLKYFMDARGINEPYSGGVGSFMLQLMIVSFLQYRERDGYNFNRPCLANLGCLLLEFLELYGLDFNYITTGISVRHDGFYFPKGAKDQKEHFWQAGRPFSLAMENPLDPATDVGRPSFRMQTVQRSFEVAFNVLLAHVSEPIIPAVSILASILPPTPEMTQRATFKRVDETLSRSLSSQRTNKTPKPPKRHSSSDMETSSSDDTPRKRRKY